MKLNEIHEKYGVHLYDVCIYCVHRYKGENEEPCNSCELTNFEYYQKKVKDD